MHRINLQTLPFSKIKILVLLLFQLSSFAQIPYGDNKEVGKYILLNNVKHYYEVYGKGTPLLLIHGNSTGIKGFAAQIDYFSEKYKVYAIDCRGRGKSDLGKDSLSFLQIANDLSEFIKQMKLDSVYIIGKSDGGIISILLGIHFPSKIKKIVAYGSNMWPDSTAMYPTSVNEIHESRIHAEQMLAKKDSSKNWLIEQQKNRMMEFQPHITAKQLQSIKIPVLVMSCDRDVIKEEHTFFIYRNIPKANLCILPGEKHGVPRLNPQLFNSTIDTYLSRPYRGNEMRFEK